MNAARTVLQFPLSMNLATRRLHEPAAWFIPGNNAGVWLAEMTQWNVSIKDARLYPIPNQIDDPQPCGVLVILKEGKPTVVMHCRMRKLAIVFIFRPTLN